MNSDKIELEEAIKYANVDNVIASRRENNLLLSDYQISPEFCSCHLL